MKPRGVRSIQGSTTSTPTSPGSMFPDTTLPCRHPRLRIFTPDQMWERLLQTSGAGCAERPGPVGFSVEDKQSSALCVTISELSQESHKMPLSVRQALTPLHRQGAKARSNSPTKPGRK